MENKDNQKKDCLPRVSNRRLTVSRYSFYLKPASPLCRNTASAPFIRLCGKWLQNTGFETGDKIQVISSKNLIVIKPEKE
jgi:hypothetical protein